MGGFESRVRRLEETLGASTLTLEEQRELEALEAAPCLVIGGEITEDEREQMRRKNQLLVRSGAPLEFRVEVVPHEAGGSHEH